MKIEIDTINGMCMVTDFSADTEIMAGPLRLKDFLKDQIEGCLGFEVSMEEAQEIMESGYGIKGLTHAR